MALWQFLPLYLASFLYKIIFAACKIAMFSLKTAKALKLMPKSLCCLLRAISFNYLLFLVLPLPLAPDLLPFGAPLEAGAEAWACSEPCACSVP